MRPPIFSAASAEKASNKASQKSLGTLRSQLLRWLLIPLLLLVALDAVSVYRNALDVADLAYDRALLASTRALAERVSIVDGKVVVDVPYVALDSFETDTLGRIYYKVTGTKGEFISGYEDLPALPPNIPRSEIYPALVRFYHAIYRGEPVRIAALYQPVYDDSMRGIALIQVGETMDARSALTRQILFGTLWRQGLLVTVTALLVWFAVRIVLRPLMQLKTAVEGRTPTDLTDFDASQVHTEVRPLVAAMNGYMGRLQTLITGQRRFIADASHQLRTPLTVLKTQAELALRELERNPQDPQSIRDIREIVHSMASTTDATVHLANRLLTLARAEHGVAEGGMVPLSLTAAVRQVGVELAPQAVKKQLDLSFDAEEDVSINGNPLMLHELITNLVDNAIRYTPPNGKIILRVRRDDQTQHGLFEIEDSGSGIPEADRERVFAAFYRAPSAQQLNPSGAGLGLSIVRDIAAAHHASILLSAPSKKSGLKVCITFPLRLAAID
ncbi:sensor histidine kinase [Glaciimonas sp. CA11.2]|uniref:sensor histidine kinase n=1 Tax=unclassified Glaciimonas TaxID=2644401 RepID=UPI002AB358E7|nr:MULTISPECIES: sensor histidine kinase [unclassified Glaciimonas]MDY7546030.1 sensor histidine kinase [Glaciimonas sp. CA11.2]MEB0012120.1 sensor histidine kinase [Glaciimonas sp. Cout2]MEB0083876.1 sensor histidine kinase [Glaciimonas sp. Gout2]MEB0162058.1 sensor histidine kinase [Glaciimonas sp. CA11.2]